MTHGMFRGVALICCFSAIGCSVLAPLPDRSRFFQLTAMSTPGDQEAPREPLTAGPAPVFGLGPVKLPAYLDRNELVTRVSPTEVSYSTTERWADPLSARFTAVLLQDLATLLDTNRILPYPGTGSGRVDYQIEVNVLQFDNDASGNTRLVARWRVRDLRNGTDLAIRETNVTQSRPPGDANAGIASLSEALGGLAQDIAGELRRLPAPGA